MAHGKQMLKTIKVPQLIKQVLLSEVHFFSLSYCLSSLYSEQRQGRAPSRPADYIWRFNLECVSRLSLSIQCENEAYLIQQNMNKKGADSFF